MQPLSGRNPFCDQVNAVALQSTQFIQELAVVIPSVIRSMRSVLMLMIMNNHSFMVVIPSVIRSMRSLWRGDPSD